MRRWPAWTRNRPATSSMSPAASASTGSSAVASPTSTWKGDAASSFGARAELSARSATVAGERLGAGADIVQIDEPYMQARPEKAREFGLKALEQALDGIVGTTAVHICFGYAAIIHQRPSGYSFLGELAGCSCEQVSIETAQSKLDCSVLERLPMKTIILGVLDLSTHEIETPEIVAGRIRRALPYVAAEKLVIAPDCGLKYLPREVAFGKMKAMVDGTKIMRSELEKG